MVRKVQPPETTPNGAEPPPEAEADGADGKQDRPARAPRTSLPDRAEVDRLIAEMRAGLTGDTRDEARELRHALALRAMERLGLVITGFQPATAPQVVTASVAVLEDNGLTDKHAAGVTAEAAE